MGWSLDGSRITDLDDLRRTTIDLLVLIHGFDDLFVLQRPMFELQDERRRRRRALSVFGVGIESYSGVLTPPRTRTRKSSRRNFGVGKIEREKEIINFDLMSLRIKAVVDKFVEELKEALDADIRDRLMKEREMQSYIEEREREVAEREAAWKAELSRREATTNPPIFFFPL
nr:Midasin like [Ipomoea batatas]